MCCSKNDTIQLYLWALSEAISPRFSNEACHTFIYSKQCQANPNQLQLSNLQIIIKLDETSHHNVNNVFDCSQGQEQVFLTVQLKIQICPSYIMYQISLVHLT